MRSLVLLALVACSEAPSEPVTAPEPVAEPTPEPATPPAHAELFKALPEQMTAASNPITPEKVELGRMLYYDTRLSVSQTISCNSCHQLDRYGVDNEPTSPGHTGERGGRNSPTTYNAGVHIAQFWDGRAATLEDQAKGPVLNPVEMGMPDADYVVRVLKTIPGYVDAFGKAFPGEADPITYDNFAAAVGAFERGLVTPSPFDAYVKGDASALTDAQKKGLDTFVEAGCTACHNGVGVGGGAYFKLGLVNPYDTPDEGRKAITGSDADLHVFKVPSLRNVTETGPYFHDGSVATLDDAIKKMGYHQLGKDLTDEQVADIKAFLGSLKGEIPVAYVAKPALPESGSETPGPS